MIILFFLYFTIFIFILQCVLFRNAKTDFEKYCAPLLHLAGYCVTVLTTEREGGARSLVENLIGETDALIVAGGDGTLSEVCVINFYKLLLLKNYFYKCL